MTDIKRQLGSGHARSTNILPALATITGAAIGAYFAARHWLWRDETAEHVPAALKSDTCANPIRNAGASNIRDLDDTDDWDSIDETSDESFPASDPPANY